MSHRRDGTRSAFVLVLAVGAGGLAGCNAPPARDASGSSTPASAAGSGNEGGSSGSGEAPGADGLTSLSTPSKTITVRYPASAFPTTKASGESLVLQSTLKRALLGEDNGDRVHRFEIRIDWLPGTPFDAVSKEFKSYPFPQMFPAGTEASFVEQVGEGSRVTVGGRSGYRVHTGVEGYNEDTSFLEVESKKTLRFRCTYVGSVMAPEIDEDRQVAICDAVLGSITTGKAP